MQQVLSKYLLDKYISKQLKILCVHVWLQKEIKGQPRNQLLGLLVESLCWSPSRQKKTPSPLYTITHIISFSPHTSPPTELRNSYGGRVDSEYSQYDVGTGTKDPSPRLPGHLGLLIYLQNLSLFSLDLSDRVKWVQQAHYGTCCSLTVLRCHPRCSDGDCQSTSSPF